MSPGNPNRVAVITAGASGIGLAMAEAFSQAAYEVLVCDVDLAALEKLEGTHPTVHSLQADVSSEADMARLYERADDLPGHLHVLVNNAGIAGPTGSAEDLTLPDWQQTLDINLNGAFLGSRLAIPRLKAAGQGCIINLSSSAGLFGYPRRLPYAAAKWGIIGMTKTLAMELGPHGIRVNALCPGGVNGDRIERVVRDAAQAMGKTTDEVRALYTQQVSMRTFVDAEDVASMAVFLASDAAHRISGQAIGVDGHTEGLSIIE